jgi:prepilin-type N-terminal cleavage/methylation domain-containing protein
MVWEEAVSTRRVKNGARSCAGCAGVASERDGGFSLIEVTIALFIMTLAALGAAQLIALGAHAAVSAKGQTSTTILAVQKMEQLRSLTWGYTRNAVNGLGIPVTDTTTNLSVDPSTGGGVGLTASPKGVLDANIPPYVDYLDANGNWVGTGATPPAGTAYVRRWSVEPLPASPNETLILQVRVIAMHREARRTGTGALRDDTILTTAKTRKGV